MPPLETSEPDPEAPETAPGEPGGQQDPLVALQAGDPRPFERFVHDQAPGLVGFFLRLGATRSEAEDLAQDSFLRMVQRLDRYQPQGRPQAWLLRIARNAWIDRRRRDAIRPWRSGGAAVDELELPVEEPGPLVAAEEREDQDRLHAALDRLPQGQREVFELGGLQGLPYGEVGEMLGIPVGTVKSRMHHAARRLRSLLEGPGGEA